MLMLSLVLLQKPNLTQNYASAGNRTRVNCLEGSYANHYTTDALMVKQATRSRKSSKIHKLCFCVLALLFSDPLKKVWPYPQSPDEICLDQSQVFVFDVCLLTKDSG